MDRHRIGIQKEGQIAVKGIWPFLTCACTLIERPAQRVVVASLLTVYPAAAIQLRDVHKCHEIIFA